MDYKTMNDYEILYLVEEQNEEAYSLLFQKYQPLIDIIVRKYEKASFSCGIERDDILQEGRIGLWQAINHYEEQKGNKFYTFACICIEGKIQNLLRTFGRKKRRILTDAISIFSSYEDNQVELLEVIADYRIELPDMYVDYDESFLRLRFFSHELPLIEACIFELKLNGFGNLEISTLLSISVASVSNRLYRVRNKLRLSLAKV